MAANGASASANDIDNKNTSVDSANGASASANGNYTSDEFAIEPKSEAKSTMQAHGIHNREAMFLPNEENVFYKKLADTVVRASNITLIAFLFFLQSSRSEEYPMTSKIVVAMFPISYFSFMFAVLLAEGKLFKILVCFGALGQMLVLLSVIACAATAIANRLYMICIG